MLTLLVILLSIVNKLKLIVHNASVNCPPDNLCNLILCSDKDWEDIKKMPEHSTLMKDFRRNTLV